MIFERNMKTFLIQTFLFLGSFVLGSSQALVATCGDTDADGIVDQFDCSDDANDIDGSPASIECTDGSCSANECCTVLPLSCDGQAITHTNATRSGGTATAPVGTSEPDGSTIEFTCDYPASFGDTRATTTYTCGSGTFEPDSAVGCPASAPQAPHQTCTDMTCAAGWTADSAASTTLCASTTCVNTGTDNALCCNENTGAACSTITCAADTSADTAAAALKCLADPCVNTGTDNALCCDAPNACANTDASAPNDLEGCDCGTEQCFYESVPGNGPYCDLNATECKWTCIAEYQKMQTSEGHLRVDQLKTGDRIKMANGKYTTVQKIKKKAAPRHALHEVECNGATAHLTDNHVYRCNNRWHHPKNRGRRLSESDETIDVYSIQTENHCKDRLLTSSGLEIEPWDGREAGADRPYFYDETGYRRNCMTVN